MSVPAINAVEWGDPGADLLVLGPSLGTTAHTLWTESAQLLADRYHILAWDLPGHGTSEPATDAFTMPELAAGILARIDASADTDARFSYAGDSIGGSAGLQLLLDAPARVDSAALLCTGAKIGDASLWADRSAGVRQSGTAAMVDASAQRWFAPGFMDRNPETTRQLLHALETTDDESYARACEALSGFDVRARLDQIAAPVLAIAVKHDIATPPELLQEIAGTVADGRVVELDDVAHLAPAEAPARVAGLIHEHVTGATRLSTRHDEGMTVRRTVLGDDHVDRANAAVTDFTADFQDLITRYAWGEIWARPGLDRRTRSLITLTALIARGHHDELAMHVRAARRNGVSVSEIKETLLQSAIYCGVPDANTAFRVAVSVLDE